MHPQVKKLLEIPKIEQKTTEWYEARHNLITASDFAQALGKGKFGTQRQLIAKKVEPNTDTSKTSNVFFEWGNLFEPVACMVYSKMHGTDVNEFGLLKHPRCDFFGASPDGITDDGVMLEIKCPLKRKITGDIPEQYYYQIQGQLDVCDLDVCDYFECEFSKYDDYDKYVEAYNNSKKGTWTGAFLNGECTICKCDTICHQMQVDAYWILQKYNIKRVMRDHTFVNEKLDELREVWEKIVQYRKDPCAFQMDIKKQIAIDTQSFFPSKGPSFDNYRIVRL